MAALSTAMALVMIASGISGLQWSPTTLQNNAVVYACATGTLSLPWSLTVAPGESIANINWFVSGMSEEMMASVVHGKFYAMPAFANRVRQLTNAGIELDHVGVSDKGNYSVEVNKRSGSGIMTTLKRAVTVHISDGLQTTDGQLHITQQPEAEYDVSSEQYHVFLSCGTFTYPTHPAFEVTWETPSGHRRTSSGYSNGSFHLRLDNPVQEGVYTCRLPAVSSCGHGNGSALSVSTSVDKTEARLLLMEARQAALDAKSRELDAKDRELEAHSKAMELANTALVRQNNALLTRTSALEGLQAQTVSFHAELYYDVVLPGDTNLVLNWVFRDHGDGYNETSGVFTAPYSGTYCFLATAAYNSSAAAAGMAVLILYTKNVGVAHILHTPGETHHPASLHAVVGLQAGDTAYLSNDYYLVQYTAHATTFSGFLVDHIEGGNVNFPPV